MAQITPIRRLAGQKAPQAQRLAAFRVISFPPNPVVWRFFITLMPRFVAHETLRPFPLTTKGDTEPNIAFTLEPFYRNTSHTPIYSVQSVRT